MIRIAIPEPVLLQDPEQQDHCFYLTRLKSQAQVEKSMQHLFVG